MKNTFKKGAVGALCLAMAATNLLTPKGLPLAGVNASAAESGLRINSLKKAKAPAEAKTINVAEQAITGGKITIKISESGKYVLTGSNYINDAYIDVQIIVDEGVVADIWLDDLSITNDDTYGENISDIAGSGMWAVVEIVPWVINGTANIHISSDSEIDSFTRATVDGTLNFVESEGDAQLRFERSISLNNEANGWINANSFIGGGGNVNILSGNIAFVDNVSGSIDYSSRIPLKIVSGNVEFSLGNPYYRNFFSNFIYDGGIINGNNYNYYQPKNSMDESVYERTLIGLVGNSEVEQINRVAQSGVSTDAEGNLGSIYLPKRDAVVYIGDFAYYYTYDSVTDMYTGPVKFAKRTVTFVDGDTNETIDTQIIFDGGTVELPTNEDYDYTFTANGSEFTAATAVTKDLTVTVTKTIKKYTVTIDGVEHIYDRFTPLPKGVYKDIDGNPYYTGDPVKCDLVKIADLDCVVIDDAKYAAISTAAELDAFSAAVNGGAATLNGALTADIAANPGFMPIGNYIVTTGNGTLYNGSFDGQGHSVTLSISMPDDKYIGFFGTVGGGVVISNLVTKGSVKGGYATGGIAGGSVGEGTVTIKNCMNYASVTGTDTDAAGIIGTNCNSLATFKITNCANVGTVTAPSYSCAISGWSGENAEITNCYNYGTVTLDNNDYIENDVYFIFIRGNSVKCTNCYQAAQGNIVQEIDGLTTEKDASRFASGEIAYLLNESNIEGAQKWYQKIAPDAYPVLFGNPETDTVYYTYPDCTATEKTYSNTNNRHENMGHLPLLGVNGNVISYKCIYCTQALATATLTIPTPTYDKLPHTVSIDYSQEWLSDHDELDIEYVVGNDTISDDPVSAGDYKIVVKDSDNVTLPYSGTMTIKMAKPDYTLPTNLTAKLGDTLASVELPKGFAWSVKSPENVVLDKIGNATYSATFTPEDTINYLTVSNVELTINVIGHIVSSEWTYNNASHWHTCICGEKHNEASHTLQTVVDTEPSFFKDGTQHAECSVCGYKGESQVAPSGLSAILEKVFGSMGESSNSMWHSFVKAFTSAWLAIVGVFNKAWGSIIK